MRIEHIKQHRIAPRPRRVPYVASDDKLADVGAERDRAFEYPLVLANAARSRMTELHALQRIPLVGGNARAQENSSQRVLGVRPGDDCWMQWRPEAHRDLPRTNRV